jgi:hypothetical protein
MTAHSRGGIRDKAFFDKACPSESCFRPLASARARSILRDELAADIPDGAEEPTLPSPWRARQGGRSVSALHWIVEAGALGDAQPTSLNLYLFDNKPSGLLE